MLGAVLATVALALFITSWWVRGGLHARPPLFALGTELTGCLLLGLAGFLGGSLVFEQRVGVKSA